MKMVLSIQNNTMRAASRQAAVFHLYSAVMATLLLQSELTRIVYIFPRTSDADRLSESG